MQRVSAKPHSVINTRALSSAGFVLCLAAGAGGCTFYSGRPNDTGATTSTPTAGAGSSVAGGSASSGAGTSQTDAGDDSGDADVDAGPVWVNATGTLAGRTSASGNVQYITTKPDEDMLIAGLDEAGLWASVDGGQTWSGLGIGGKSDPIINGVNSIVFDPQHTNVFWESGIYTGGGVYKTEDDGVTINELGTITHIDLLGVDFSDPDRKTILAGVHETIQKMFQSMDGGQTWNDIGPNVPADCGFSSNPLVLDANTYVLGCVSKIVRSTDAGLTWDIVSNTGGYAPPLVTSDGTIYWGTSDNTALMRSTDQGLTWTRAVSGGLLVTYRLLELPDHRLASISKDYVVVSPDGGVHWQVASPKFPYTPKGFAYSRFQKAFYISTDSPDTQIPANSIMTFPFDYETQ